MKSAATRSYTVILIILALLIPGQTTSAQQISRPSGQIEDGSNLSAGRRQDEPVSIKLERGDKVSVDNRTTGRIRVMGWDKDFVEARATSERGAEAVRVNVAGDSPDKRIWLKADYARREEAETPGPRMKPAPATTKPETETSPVGITGPTSSVGITRPTLPTTPSPPPPKPSPSPKQFNPPENSGTQENSSTAESSRETEISINNKREISYEDDGPALRDGRPIEVDLEVSVPRYAEIEVIKVTRSNVEVSGVETPLIILGDKSTVVLRNVGAVEVRARNGAVEVENASGLVEVVTTSGQIDVRRAGSDVRALSISGAVQIECARGRVYVDSTDGKIMLNNVQGDVDANTSNSDVLFAGAIRDDGRYHLKSMSGTVEMVVQDRPPGFSAALSSYRGAIENAFQLKTKQSSQHEEAINRRIIGSYGNGRAQIMLDTFDGKVNLRKAPMSAMKECK
jgi:hypothetical protein